MDGQKENQTYYLRKTKWRWEMTMQLVKLQPFKDLRDCWKDTDGAIIGLKHLILFLVDSCHIREFLLTSPQTWDDTVIKI